VVTALRERKRLLVGFNQYRSGTSTIMSTSSIMLEQLFGQVEAAWAGSSSSSTGSTPLLVS
jgi:hypothetical protein